MKSATTLSFPRSSEPLTTDAPDRESWVNDAGGATARAYKSWLQNNTNNNTLHQMARKETFDLADADGGGTIDKSEFSALFAAAGGKESDANLAELFAEFDKDNDGEVCIRTRASTHRPLLITQLTCKRHSAHSQRMLESHSSQLTADEIKALQDRKRAVQEKNDAARSALNMQQANR